MRAEVTHVSPRVPGATRVPGWWDRCTGGRAMAGAGCWGPSLRRASPRPRPRGRPPQESSLGRAGGFVPAVPSPTWGSRRGHRRAARLRSGDRQRGLGTNSCTPSELKPEPSSPQLLPFAGSIPRFAASSQPSAAIPSAGGRGFLPPIRTHGAVPRHRRDPGSKHFARRFGADDLILVLIPSSARLTYPRGCRQRFPVPN